MGTILYLLPFKDETNTDIEQWNRIESQGINPLIHRQLIYNKEQRTTYSGERTVSSISDVGKTEQSHAKKSN